MATKSQTGLTSLQCRMARAALRWTVTDLAERVPASRNTISRFESEKSKPTRATIAQMRQVFEGEGVQFLNGDGVRVREKKAEAPAD